MVEAEVSLTRQTVQLSFCRQRKRYSRQSLLKSFAVQDNVPEQMNREMNEI